MDEYLQQLEAHFARQANPDAALPMQKYMRDQFEFLGIKTPERTRLLKQFAAQQGWPDLSYVAPLVAALWQLPAREYQYIALDILERYRSQLTPSAVPTLERLILEKSWWDTVDNLAIRNVGDLFSCYPAETASYLEKWRSHPNIWLRRTTLLFQLSYKSKTDERLLFALIKENLNSDEFFIKKAIGWALREYSKTAPEAVRHFVATTDLRALSRREALKWLKKHSLQPAAQ